MVENYDLWVLSSFFGLFSNWSNNTTLFDSVVGVILSRVAEMSQVF